MSAQQDTTRTRPDSTARTLDPMVVRAARDGSTYAPERILSAMKSDIPLRDTPQSVTLVTRALIADQSMQSMADVVRYMPGITMGQGEGHRDQPTIRGNATTADFFVDGVRDDAQYYRDLYNTERVEALKGSNAMIFGRGGGGGVINRVSKEAGWAPLRDITLEAGSFDHRRSAIDIDQPLSSSVAVRFNGMYDKSGSFRNDVSLDRYGINPTMTVLAGRTALKFGYEYFDDSRVVDRGIPSFNGLPVRGDIGTFFGNPDTNHARATVHSASTLLERAGDRLTLRNRTRYMHYNKFYQNVLPGAVNAVGTHVSLSAYNNRTLRGNLFNQTDVLVGGSTGALRHSVVFGAELGQSLTDNYRQTGYFDSTATSKLVPLTSPTVAERVAFRQSATDADNHVSASVAAAYAQDQITISRYVQVVAGVRYERFNVALHNNRAGSDVSRADAMLSPRGGVVVKPTEHVSLYGSTSVSYLPSAGDQFSSLNATTQTLEPERFQNYEIGAKWAVLRAMELTTALYRLDRSNSAAKDPNDPTRTVQTGAQRTTGYELGLTGTVVRGWDIAGGYAVQRATILNATSSGRAGATVPLVPRSTMSLWNKVQVTKPFGVGLGVTHQTKMYAAIDNAVTLPGFTRLDGAMYLRLARDLRLQLNVENVLDDVYYWTSQGNNNIMPGASRTFRVTIGSGL